MRSKPWTADETARALKMRDDKMTIACIAEALGRTPKAVKVRICRLSMTPEERDRRNKYERDRRAQENTTKIAGIKFEAHKSRVPDGVLSERNARISLQHRDLTAAFFNDPLPGYSALDRRQGA
jgi:hypothetical protein